MKPRITFILITMSFIFTLCITQAFGDLVQKPKSAGPSGTKGEIKALVVGINTYPTSALPYARQDAQDFASLLSSLGCNKITSLYDRDATYNNITKALKDVTAGCSDSDVFIFFYSGHGSYYPDKNGDEADGIDEGLVVLNDTPTRYPVFLCDDDIDNIMKDCRAKISWLIFDSCHSGGSAKAFTNYSSQNIREYKGDICLPRSEKPIGQRARPGNEPVDKTGFIGDTPTNPREVVLTGTKSDELGWEYGSLKHGVFSYYLLDALKNSPTIVDTSGDKYLSFSEIYNYCLDKVSTYRYEQHPTKYIGSGVITQSILKLNSDGSVVFDIPGIDPGTTTPPKITNNQLVKDLASQIESKGSSDKPKYQLSAISTQAGGSSSPKSSFKPNEDYGLSINVDQPCYLYILNVFYNDKVLMLYPNDNYSNNQVSKTTVNQYDILGAGSEFYVLEDTQPGTEYLLVIASPVKLNLDGLCNSREYIFGEIKYAYGSRGCMAQITNTLTKDLANSRASGIRPDNSLLAQKSVTTAIIEYTVTQ